MNTVALDDPGAEQRSRGRLGPAGALIVYTAIAVAFLAASSAPTPLYAVYQAAWGLDPVVLTAVFAAYPLALLVALLTVGTLSDHLGRRPVVLVSLVVQIISMCVFFVAPSAPVLIAARLLQGVASGAATAAFGAALVDLHPRRGTFVNSIAPMGGLAAGALGSSVIVTYAAAPTDAVFTILSIVFCSLLACAFFLPETHERRPGAWASLAIRLRVPEAVRPALWTAAPVLIAVWAIGGFVLSLGPNLAEDLMATGTALPGGFFVFALTGTGMAAVLWHRRHRARTVFISGSVALALGVGAVMAAPGTQSAWLLYGGAIVAGYGFGAAFQGALQTILPAAAAHERSGLMATVYSISYLSNAVPALGAGVVTSLWGVTVSSLAVGGLVVLLAAFGLAATLRTAPRHR